MAREVSLARRVIMILRQRHEPSEQRDPRSRLRIVQRFRLLYEQARARVGPHVARVFGELAQKEYWLTVYIRCERCHGGKRPALLPRRQSREHAIAFRPEQLPQRWWCRQPLFGIELQRRRVDAVPQPGWLGPVVEHVPEVAAAVAARHFSADHAVAAIHIGVHGIGRGGRPEAWPA